jgi:hypothetical protein
MTGWRLMIVRKTLLTICLVLIPAAACLAQTVNVPLTGLKLAASAGVAATVDAAPGADGATAAVRVRYTKTSEERRLIALEAPVSADLTGLKAGELRYRLQITEGAAPRAGVVLFDGDGGSWYKVAAEPLKPGGFQDARLPLGNLQLASYAEDESGKLELNTVKRAWVALLVDGAGKGTVEISGARLTNEPYKPAGPFRVTGPGAGTWGISQDPAVSGKVTTVPDGCEGRPCIKYEFSVPAGRHMYAIPNTSIAAGEYDGYSALRFRYKAAIPTGMKLLVTLPEKAGAAYYVEPAGPWAGEWTTMTVPFSDLKLASWGQKDANGKFDPGDISGVQIGCHGTPAAAGPGWLWVADVELLP